jgi:hypothetical protein
MGDDRIRGRLHLEIDIDSEQARILLQQLLADPTSLFSPRHHQLLATKVLAEEGTIIKALEDSDSPHEPQFVVPSEGLVRDISDAIAKWRDEEVQLNPPQFAGCSRAAIIAYLAAAAD